MSELSIEGESCVEAPATVAEAVVEGDQPTLRAWLSVLSVSLGAFASVTTEFLPVGLLPSVARDLHVTDGVAGLMVTVPGIAAAVAAPAVTVLSGRLDRRRLLCALTLLLVASNVLSALAPNFAVMLFGRLLLGISLGSFWSIAASMAGRLVPEAHAGKALALILAGISIGTIVGVPAGVVIASVVGWRGTFGAIAIIAAAVFIKQLLTLPSLPTHSPVRLGHLTGLLRNRSAMIGFLAGAFVINGQFAAYTYITPFLEQVTHVSSSMLGSILLGYGLAGLIGNIIAGMSTHRFLRGTFIAVGALMGGGAALLPIVGHSMPGAIAVLLVWGVGFGALPMCVQLWTFKAAPDAPESASSVLVTVFQVSIAIGAGWGGRLVDAVSTSAVMYAGGLSIGVGLLILIAIRSAPTGAPPVGRLAH